MCISQHERTFIRPCPRSSRARPKTTTTGSENRVRPSFHQPLLEQHSRNGYRVATKISDAARQHPIIRRGSDSREAAVHGMTGCRARARRLPARRCRWVSGSDSRVRSGSCFLPEAVGRALRVFPPSRAFPNEEQPTGYCRHADTATCRPRNRTRRSRPTPGGFPYPTARTYTRSSPGPAARGRGRAQGALQGRDTQMPGSTPPSQRSMSARHHTRVPPQLEVRLTGAAGAGARGSVRSR